MSGTSRLELRLVAVRFGREAGLSAISLAVAPGETVAIVGTSGAGKGSLLRAIAGLEPVAGGSVVIEGVDRSSAPPEARGAVYLHQTPLLFPHLSVAENIAFPLRVRRVDAMAIAKRVDEVLEKLRLGSLRDRDPATLSGGQRHRVALARAIAGRPPVLLLDEPLTGLDPATRAETLEAIRSALADYDPATLYVTHDLAEAGSIADRIGVLLAAEIQQIDTPVNLFEQPASAAVAEFVGFSNRITGESDGSTFRAGLWEIPLQTDFTGRAVLLFRPQSLYVEDAGELTGEVLSVAHSPQGPRLRVKVQGVELDATASRSGMTERGDARFRLDNPGLRIFAEL